MTRQALKERFQQEYPNTFFLDAEQRSELTQYLQQQEWLPKKDSIQSVEKPGEGNMNYVLRIQPQQTRSFIIKQARPWVEKYPQIDAPIERIHIEHKYYTAIQQTDRLQAFSPKIIGFDPNNFLLAMEDLGAAKDYTFLYQKGEKIASTEIEEAMQYLNMLNNSPAPIDYPSNQAMRILNHQHIFVLPFLEDNGFDLDAIQPGLQTIAKVCQQNEQLRTKAAELGALYLSPGNTLLHGDFYPGSLLHTSDSLKVIDPEFSFLGPPEWDLAIFIAHLYMAQTPEKDIQKAIQLYQPSPDFLSERLIAFIGIEILRRLIGLAQLPLALKLEEKVELIEQASAWALNGKF